MSTDTLTSAEQAKIDRALALELGPVATDAIADLIAIIHRLDGELDESFTDQQPFTVTRVHLRSKWGGGQPGERFRCYLCGYRFRLGDVARWQYTNDTPGAGGNPLVCHECDGTKEEIVARWKQMYAESNGRMWWFCRDLA